MHTYKTLAKATIPAALSKAERYRLINDPYQAESICRDILAVDPKHEQALITLLLALTDQFPERGGEVVREAQDLPTRLPTEYERAYYAGLVCERWGRAQLRHMPAHTVYHWLRKAMDWFERAEKLAVADNPDAVLRWNACARVLDARPELMAKEAEDVGGDEPPR